MIGICGPTNLSPPKILMFFTHSGENSFINQAICIDKIKDKYKECKKDF